MTDLASRLDAFWILVAAALVLLMQIGFLLLEAGAVRTKNAVNVAQKNLLDLAFAVIAFFSIGYMIGFGPSHGSLPIGFDPRLMFLRDISSREALLFIFQVMFCGTAATIIAGAVAERMKLSTYVLLSFLTAALIYPIFVHWAWGAAHGAAEGAWLGNLGFVDFAGSTVVHSTGAWIALAACLVLRPRIGRFDADGRPVRFTGHSPVLSAAGTLMLFVGWIGFNGGSTLAASAQVAEIVLNTVLAGAAGAGAAYAYFHYKEHAAYPERATNGMIGGLVAITAGCHLLDPGAALLVGLFGGLIASWGNNFLETRLRVDDAVGAVGAHGFAGVFGTLALALLAPASSLPTGSHLDQLYTQAIGVAANFSWAFGIGLVLMLVLNRLTAIRVDQPTEQRGLNVSEHQALIGTAHVEEAMRSLNRGDADLSMRLETRNGDDAQDLTDAFNDLMRNLEATEFRRRHDDDIRRSAEEADRLAAFADATFEAIVLAGEHRVIDANSAAERLFGIPTAQMRGRFVKELFPTADWPGALSHLQDHTERPTETHIRPLEGVKVPVEFRCRTIDYSGRTTQVLAFADLRERKKAEARIYHLAMHDTLTDLPNRAHFNQRLRDLLGRLGTDKASVALLLIDLDQFKNINDLHGHPSGDAVIVAVAERLRMLSGPGDCVARLGGDEFAFVQADINFPNQAADLAHRLLHALSEPVLLPTGDTIRPGASIGVAIAPRDADDAETLFQHCDVSLYAAKNNGRNTYAVYEPGMGEELRSRQEMEEALKTAIAEEQFELHFQPRLDVASGTIISYEALLRWEHPVRGRISPVEFIPVAEQSNLIVGLGEWALRKACETATRHFGDVRVSVNVSPRQFRGKEFSDTVQRVLSATGLHPSRLELEVTESLFIDNANKAFAVLNELKAMGVHIALDDFGSGYSSLNYVNHFPFDTIKIDQSFIREMNEATNALHIIDTILRLSAGLGMSVVAEGVEYEAQLEKLVAMGCKEIQGFLVSRPVPVSELPVEVPAHVVDILERTGFGNAAMTNALEEVGTLMRDAQSDRPSPLKHSA
ncbi:ammonium transporter [Oricola sp.]|uniref:ammonium transporter n=1 Tax=Oricola sp. TaxID=1979950 RepID=UPI0025CE276B|nr:ammonium transporter [Oricola sp.]MCI5077298.1 ammonium transporter [Oricola sp.]